MASKILVEKENQIKNLRTELERKIALLPKELQSTPVSVLVSQIAPIFEGVDEGHLDRSAQSFSTRSISAGGGRVGYMSSIDKFLTAGKDFKSSSEEQAMEQATLRMVQEEMMDADEPNYLDEEDMNLFERRPLADSLTLVTCNTCNKPVKESHYAQHEERCQMLLAAEDDLGQQDVAAAAAAAQKPPRKGRRKTKDMGESSRGGTVAMDADDNCGVGASGAVLGGNEDPSALLARGKARGIKRTQGGEVPEEDGVASGAGELAGHTSGGAHMVDNISPRKRAKLSPRTPLTADELEVCCGVVSSHTNAPCRRPITCKYHPESAKRAVLGRKRPYDVLLQEMQARGGHRVHAHDGVVRGMRTQGLSLATSNSQQRVPFPLASKKYCLRNRHGMRGVVASLFREACGQTSSHQPQPSSGHLETGAAGPRPHHSMASGAATPPPGAAATEVKKPKSRPKKGPVPALVLPIDPTPSLSPASGPSPEAQERSPGQKPKSKSRPKPAKEAKPATQPAVPTAAATTAKAKPSKSIKQQKAMQRAQQELLQKQQQEALMQPLPQLLPAGQRFVPEAITSLLSRSHSQNQTQAQAPTSQGSGLKLPMQLQGGEEAGQLNSLQGAGNILQTMTAVGTSGNQAPEPMAVLGLGDRMIIHPPQESDPLQRLLTGGLAHPHAPPQLNVLGFPPSNILKPPLQQQLQIGSPTGAAMLAGASTDWGALP